MTAASDLSVELFVKPNRMAQQDFVSQQDGGGTGRSILFMGADGAVRSYLGGKTTQSRLTLAAGKWSHVVLLVEENGAADTISFYVNGQADLNVGTANVESNIGQWVFGSHKSGTSSLLDGALDEIAISDRLLTEAEILSHFRATELYRQGLSLLLK